MTDPGSIADQVASPELVASLLADGDDDLAAWALEQALEERGRAAVFDDVVRGAMELVGERWETQQWTISEEHLASVALAAALARIRPAEAAERRAGPVAVLAAPTGEHHVAGLACLAQVLEESGWQVDNLGANVPADDLVRFAASRSVDLIALTVATEPRINALRATIAALDALEQPAGRPHVIVGGRGVRWLAPAPDGVDLIARSLEDVQGFARTLAGAWWTEAKARGDAGSQRSA
jgi:methanogenic corrinoid protein MtbC1